jgi:copper homeostasis protein
VSVRIEACVDSIESALAAVEGGADRLELCDNLAVGGTTPREQVLRTVKERAPIPVFAMIRPRGGPFVYSDDELAHMSRDIERAKMCGADGIVIGVLDREHRVDLIRTRQLVDLAGDTPVTFHRAFDLVPDKQAALDALIRAGVKRVLTSGGPETAEEGTPMLAQLVDYARDRILVLAGGSVRAHNVRDLVQRTGVREVHARCELEPARIAGIRDALGEPRHVPVSP